MARRASIATAFSASPPICSMSPPKSSRSSMPTAGPSRSFINRPRRLPAVQAFTRLPSSAQPQSERHRNPNLLRDHRRPGNRPLDRPPADQTNERTRCSAIKCWAGPRPTNGKPTWRSSNSPTNRPQKKSDRPPPLAGTTPSESLHAARSTTRRPESLRQNNQSAPLEAPPNLSNRDSNQPDRQHPQPNQLECRTVLGHAPKVLSSGGLDHAGFADGRVSDRTNRFDD